MMMPANFSAISENELTYVNGGAVLANILAPALKVENWQTFNKNMVTLIGNHFVQEYVNNTVGVLFGGSYRPGAMAGATRDTLSDYFWGGYRAGFGKEKDLGFASTTDKFLNVNNGLLNAGLRMVGSAAAIYNLATGTVKNVVGGDNFGAF